MLTNGVDLIGLSDAHSASKKVRLITNVAQVANASQTHSNPNDTPAKRNSIRIGGDFAEFFTSEISLTNRLVEIINIGRLHHIISVTITFVDGRERGRGRLS